MSALPKEADREVLYCLDPVSWEASLLSAPQFAHAIRESDQLTRPVRHATKIVLHGLSDVTHNLLNTHSQIVLAGNPPVTRTFTWPQMLYAIRAVTADEVIWHPRTWMNYPAFPATIEVLNQMKPYWRNVDHVMLRSKYPQGGELLQRFARCCDNALKVTVKPFEEPWLRNGGQYDAPWFPDEEQTVIFLQLLPQTTTLDTARITTGIRAQLTEWLQDGKPNTLRVYHSDQEDVDFIHALGIRFHQDTTPATYTIRLGHPERNWKYRVQPTQILSPVGRNDTTREVLRMGHKRNYYQIDRMPFDAYVADLPNAVGL